MNYYNPYFGYPYMGTTAASNGGIFSKLFGKSLNWSSILSGTQKTLGVVNQAIPIVKQVSPVMKNAKTMFRIMNEFKKVDTAPINVNDTTTSNDEILKNEPQTNITYSNNNTGPTFFI